MAYRRKPYGTYSYNSDNGPTTVHIHWSQKSGSYVVKYGDLRHFNECQMFNYYMKTRPWGEWEYDPESKTWYLAEKHLDGLLQMIELLGPNGTKHLFDIDLQRKPTGQTSTSKFIPMDVYLDSFKKLSGEDIKALDYDKAKKVYRRACMKLHPDRNGGDGSQMSSLNEAWMHIEKDLYKTKKEPEYAS